MHINLITGITLWTLFLVSRINGLYEDQVKKFDWRSNYIGALSYSHLELNTFTPRLIVATRENVLASLCPKTGDIVWRKILETGSRGNIKFVQATRFSDSSNTAAVRQNSKDNFDLLTVQGHAPALIRGWNRNTGGIEWEWSLMPLQVDVAADAFWFMSNQNLYHVVPLWKSHLEITQYLSTSGDSSGTTGRLDAPWISKEKCVLSGVFYTCVEGNNLITMDLSSPHPQILTKTLNNTPKLSLTSLTGSNGAFVIDEALIRVKEEVPICANLKSASFLTGEYNQMKVIAQADVLDNQLQIRVFNAETCTEITELHQTLTYPEYYGKPSLNTFDCKVKRVNDGKGCLFILATADDAILAVQQNRLRWVREESLANVVATEFIELPLADSEGALETDMKGDSGDESGAESDLISAFLRRLTTQVHQIQNFIGSGPPPSESQRAGLVRDSFGLHKMIVVLTKAGKLFGMDNINGKHHWQLYIPNIRNFANDENMRLITQRTPKHFPLTPLCTVIAKNGANGFGLLYSFNPISGKPEDGGLKQLNYEIKQMALLGEMENTYIKGLLVLDATNKPHAYPENAKYLANGMFLFTADKAAATMDGFYIKYENEQLLAIPSWNIHFGGHTGEHQIVALASKNPTERVHSQGRVLGDRSVLYKYLNPNLVAVVTQANDNIHKYLLNIHLVDVVSGAIVFSMTHRKVRGPVHIVHSENWLAYSYYNDKVRRTEISTLELYEGKTQANSTAWSSFNAPLMPMVERQSFILPTIVQAMKETITERGISNKHVLIGTSTGGIIEMPWALLDPRRPITSNTQGREEGAIPYMPELPLASEHTINYNQTVGRINHIYTSPSGLESTCLVMATGLDIFVTRVSPSKTFDLLKEDFDYVLISVVLVVLTSGAMVAKHLASRKQLKQAWK